MVDEVLHPPALADTDPETATNDPASAWSCATSPLFGVGATRAAGTPIARTGITTPGLLRALFAFGTALNAAFVAAQVFYGLAAHSVALLADAVHNLGYVLGLFIARGAASLARLGAERHPGLADQRRRAFAWLRRHRVGDPAPVGGSIVIWVAALGIFINRGTALLFIRERKGDLNVKGALLHMASDAMVFAGVVVSGPLITLTGWPWLDPATSLAIGAVITVRTWSMLRNSANRTGLASRSWRRRCNGCPASSRCMTCTRVWGLSTTETALTRTWWWAIAAEFVWDGVPHNPPGALAGTGLALLVLLAIVVVPGPALTLVPLELVELGIDALMLGMRWLRSAPAGGRSHPAAR